ncbi:MAG: PTS sugar transporter subunit IIB [marine benthic group bacterium]|nr:PTS sugar transporter subunit IIB [Gemmatimonadota bacterium]
MSPAMALDLFRIDERLLHGQVIVGWGMRLELEYYVIVDDEVAASEWEKDLYAAGLPEGVDALFVGLEEAIERFEELDALPGRGALLTRSPSTMRSLAEAGILDGRRVNVGGLHAGAERRRVLPYVHLSPDEIADLRKIEDRCRHVSARDLPSAREVPFEELVRAAG